MRESALDQVRRKFFAGDIGDALQQLASLETGAADDAAMLQEIAAAYLQCAQHEAARRCYQRAVNLQPENPDFLYNLATSLTAFGELDAAERLFDRIIAINPRDGAAWLNRSILRRRTVDDNHVPDLQRLHADLPPNHPEQVPLCFALSRELEDLGRHAESWTYLQHGAHRRRLGMQYDIRRDEAALAAVADHFDQEFLAAAGPGFRDQRPVFILGLPRSGTTLVERIVTAHSEVGSLGEHPTLGLAVTRLAGGDAQAGPENPDGRLELIRRAASIDPAELGRAYCHALDGFGNPASRLIDKTPQNFLYLGLIAKSLPEARILHLRRHPLDSCYAMYKTLFRAGYPFSYSLQETGRYYLAYYRLMEHWRRLLPHAFLDVDYERLVDNPHAETSRILEYLDLPWQDRCLEFHRQAGAAATASAAQVRRPIYSSSVGLWRRYRQQLAPLAARLQELGVQMDLE